MNGKKNEDPYHISNLFSMRGRTALVTGGGGGIGTAVARALSAAGANVITADVSLALAEAGAAAASASASAAGSEVRCEAAQLDVENETQIDEVFLRAEKTFGHVDVVVNAAGILERSPAIDYNADAFRRVMNINMMGMFLVSRRAAGKMLANGRGSIVNFASVAGIVGYAGTPAYQASKAAIIQLTRALAIEWAPTIRVNAIAPGSVETPMTAAVQRDHGAFRAEFIKKIPFQRPAEAIEMAGPVLLMCSDAASYMTGHTMVVDGGYTVQ